MAAHTPDKPKRAADAATPTAPPVTQADIREKLEELESAVGRTVTEASQGGGPKILGMLLGAAAALGIAFLAGRRSCN